MASGLQVGVKVGVGVRAEVEIRVAMLQGRRGPDLEAAAVRNDRASVPDELVQAAPTTHDVRPGVHEKVVGVAEHQLRPRLVGARVRVRVRVP